MLWTIASIHTLCLVCLGLSKLTPAQVQHFVLPYYFSFYQSDSVGGKFDKVSAGYVVSQREDDAI